MAFLQKSSFYTLIFLIGLCLSLKIKTTKHDKGVFDMELKKVDRALISQADKDFITITKYSSSQDNNNQTQNSKNMTSTMIQTIWYTDLNLEMTNPTYFYIGNITIGTPKKQVSVIFDTGSGFTWLASKKCLDNNSCRGVKSYYSHTESSTSKQLGLVLDVSFGRGSLQGQFYEDEVSLSKEIVMRKETIGEIEKITDNIFVDGEISGVLGLAFNSTCPETQHNFFDGLVNSKTLDRNVIGFYFGENRGLLNFGYIDANKYKGELHVHPVIDKYYWTLQLDEIYLGNTNLNLCNSKCRVIVDSGSSGIIATPKLYKKLVNKINFDGDSVKLKPLTFVINNIPYSLENYTYEYVERITKIKKYNLDIRPLNLPRFDDNTLVLGEGFFKKYYIVLDRDIDSVHIGLKK